MEWDGMEWNGMRERSSDLERNESESNIKKLIINKPKES
jgi:hypothetical protein